MEAITKSQSFTVWTKPFLNEEDARTAMSPGRLAEKARELAAWTRSRTRELATSFKPANRKRHQAACRSSMTVHQIMQEDSTTESDAGIRDEEEPTVMSAMLRWVAVPLVLLLAFIAYFQLSEHVRELKETVAALESDLGDARANIATLTEEKGVLQEEKAGLLAERKQLQSTVAVLNGDLSTERQNVSRLEGELAETKQTLSSTIARFETRVRGLEGVVESQKATIAVRDQLIGSLESDVEVRDARIASQEDALSRNKGTIASLRDEVAAELKTNTDLRSKASGLRGDLDKAFQQIEVLGQEVAAAAKSAEEMASRSQTLEKELEASFAQTEALKQSKLQAETRLSRIQDILGSTTGAAVQVKSEPKPPVTEEPAVKTTANEKEFPVPSKRSGLDLVSFRKLVSARNR